MPVIVVESSIAALSARKVGVPRARLRYALSFSGSEET